MRRKAFTAAAPSPLPAGEARGEGAARGFSLVELLVAIAIILVLLALGGAALSNARLYGTKQKTRASIAAIDAILQRHFAGGASSSAAAVGSGAARGVAIRRQLTADMPDSWEEVKYMKSNPEQFKAARQRGYVAYLDAVNPSDKHSDAECLFMIVMQGGLADCLNCGTLDGVPIGDKDEDGAPEFLDAWGEPIRYVLWPAGFELQAGTKFFAQSAPFDGSPPTADTAGTMRPLILSGGPSKRLSTGIHSGSYLRLDDRCGDPADPTIKELGGLKVTQENPDDDRADNITNFDAEVRR